MAFNLGEKIGQLWRSQPWYVWAAGGLTAGAIAYVVLVKNKSASSGSTASTADTPLTDIAIPPGEAVAPGSSAGYSPPAPIAPPGFLGPPISVTRPPIPPRPVLPPAPQAPPRPLGPPIRRVPAPQAGHGGSTSPLAAAFSQIHWPNAWHENHAQLAPSVALPFHTAGEF